MPVRKIARKQPTSRARTARRPVPAPRFTRVERNVNLVAPPDCYASLILKQVGHDEHRYYAWWVLVGREDQDAMTVSYKYTGEDTLRCDLPVGTPLSQAALQPYLARFLKSEGTQEGDTPIIRGMAK